MRKILKICGMRSVQNIAEILKLSPTYLGYIFYPGSIRYVDQTADLSAYLTSVNFSSNIGVWVNPTLEDIQLKASDFPLAGAQLHGDEDPDFCYRLKSTNLLVIKAFGLDEKFDFKRLKTFEGAADYYLFDTKTEKHGGSGMKFPWEKLEEYVGVTPFLLSGGIAPGDVIRINHPLMAGVDINSKFEISPGIKDPLKIASFKQNNLIFK